MQAEARNLFWAASVSGLGTWVTIYVAQKNGWVARPRQDRWNQRTVVKFGGVAIVLALSITSFSLHLPQRLLALVALTAAMGAVGLVDDLFILPPLYKLGAQILVCALAMASGISYGTIFPNYISFALTLLWMLAITNAFNLLDNMDGLSAGIGLIATISLFAMILGRPDPLGSLLLCMAGALLGFLFFNFNPARIFMGDTGSLAIGFFLASATVLGAGHFSSLFSVVFVPALVLFIPIFDLLLVSVTRRLRGRAISAGAKDHSSHRLVMLGLTERQAVLTLYVIGSIGGLIAFVGKTTIARYSNAILASFFVFGVLFWLYLAKLQLPEEWLSRSNVLVLVIPQLLTSIAQRAGAVFMDSVLIVLSMYLSFVLRFDGIGVYLQAFLFVCALAVAVKIALLAVYSCYRRQWEIKSLADLYPILKATGISSALIILILTYANRMQDFSRTVFVVDALFTAAMLSVARISHRLFDDILPHPARKCCLLVDSAKTQLALKYLEWAAPDREILGILSDRPMADFGEMGVPIRPLESLAHLLRTEDIQAVYLSPQCEPEAVQRTIAACAAKQIPVYRIDFSEVELTPGPSGKRDNVIPMQTHAGGN